MKKKETIAKRTFKALKIEIKDYPKVTFRLSVIGFIGSLGFYVGVLRDLNKTPEDKSQELIVLKKQNQRLENHIDLLIENR